MAFLFAYFDPSVGAFRRIGFTLVRTLLFISSEDLLGRWRERCRCMIYMARFLKLNFLVQILLRTIYRQLVFLSLFHLLF